MPYIITTNEPFNAAVHVHRPAFTRRAVATLEEARDVAHDVMLDRSSVSTWPEGSNAANWRAASDLPEAGGTVTLPDGTVIEVREVSWPWLAECTTEGAYIVRADGEHATRRRIINAYNAAQKTPA